MKPTVPRQRGYFGIGVEGISKPMNLGAIMRTANAFDASFTFSVNAARNLRLAYKADTSKTFEHMPYYEWDSIADMALPAGCQLIGVELTDDAVDLPSFRHPLNAAYVLGREAGDLSPEMLARCAHVVKIPTRFCINVSLAAALVMYDRVMSMGGYAARPMMPGGPDGVSRSGQDDTGAKREGSGTMRSRVRGSRTRQNQG